MSAEMKASVLLTLKDELTGKAKGAANALKDLGASAKSLGGASGLGVAAKDAETLAGAAAKAGTATRETASAASTIGKEYAAAAKHADALASAANRAASASVKASAAAHSGAASGKEAILYGPAAHENAAKANTALMPVKGNEYQKAAVIAGNLERANPSLYAGPKGAALLEKHVGEQLDHAKASGKTLGGKAMDAYFAVAVGQMAVHGVDHIISKAGDVSAMREKLKWSLGGDKKGADAAYAKAVEMSGKYKNTSVVENMHIIDDLRANLPEDMDHILKDSLEPFVKMHGFFKAWSGGKHAGTAEKSLQAIGAAIRSGELMGDMSGAALAKHAEAMSNAQVVFGDKFNNQKYLQGVQKAATALASSDDTFKYVDFPVLLQRLNDGGAVALRGLFDKAGSGNKVAQGSAEAWRKLDLVDMSQVETGKDGKIKGGSLLGKPWLKGADDYRSNMTDAIMTKVVPALAEKGGLKDLAGLDAAWKAKDAHKITEIMAKFREDKTNMGKLAAWAAALAKDPKAAQAVEELILGAASIQQDRKRIANIQKDKEDFTTYDKSKQEVGAQADRLLQVVSGEDLSGNIAAALSGLASSLGTAADDVMKFNQSIKDGSVLGAGKALIQGLAHVIRAPAKPGEKEDWGLVGAASDWIKDRWNGKPSGTATAGDGPMGPPVPNHIKYGGRYQPDDGQLATGPAVPTLVGANMAAGADGQAPSGVTIQANGPQVMFNQAPPVITTNVTVNVTTNAGAHEIGAAVGASVGNAMNNSGALHDGAY
jgi:hypothetical protein